MSSGRLNAPAFRKAQRLKRELNLNINTNSPLLIRIVSGMYGRIRSTDL
jgi:hypothetical protein